MQRLCASSTGELIATQALNGGDLRCQGRHASGPLHRRRGGSLLEIMLVLPIMIMLSFGVVDYGYAMYLKNTVQGAALIGARTGIISSSTNSSVTSAISSYMTSAGLSGSGYTVTLTPSDVSTVATGSTFNVQISVTWANAGTHMLGTSYGGISGSKTISGSVTMVHE